MNYKGVTTHYQSAFNQHVVTVNASWRKLPHLLEVLREVPIDIRRAYIQSESSTLFISSGSPYLHSEDVKRYMMHIASEGFQHAHHIDHHQHRPHHIDLPIDTQIMLYNIPNLDYSTMEFFCKDRIGLLSDLLQHMTTLDVELHDAFITTFGEQAHNIFHLQKRDQPLDHHQLAYIRNVFEHVVKPRFLE